MQPRKAISHAIAAATAASFLAACSDGNQYVAPPPPRVTVAPPTKQQVTRYLEATGSTAAVNSTDLVARVAGFVQEINDKDGDQVKKGTLLFTIEPESYKLKLEQSKAAEISADASLKQAQASFQRQADLLPRQSTTQANYDQALAGRDNAQGNLDQAKANTQMAQLNYDYTHVTAPFDGIVTTRVVSVGQYVGGNATPTVLASIIQHDPIYVNFNISEQDVLRIRGEMARRGRAPEDIKTVVAEVGLQSETGYHIAARLTMRHQPSVHRPARSRRAPSCRMPITFFSPAISCVYASPWGRRATRCWFPTWRS